MNIIGIIPSRMASSRFPGKAMAKILGMPMIGRVYLKSKMCSLLKNVYVATCDEEIANYIRAASGEVIMTSKSHERATDRTAEALIKIEDKLGERVDIAIMIQGDEPMVHPEMLEKAIRPMMEENDIQVVNLMSPIKSIEEENDLNIIKVVTDINGFALYFSREPIPTLKRGLRQAPMYKQVCIMPFRRDFLIRFSRLSPTPLEQAESVDMLRVLEHGYKVKMVLSEFETYSVDTITDLKRVERLLENDLLVKRFSAKDETK